MTVMRSYLDFEKPVAELEAKVEELRAVAARDGGFFDREIIPVPLADGTIFSKDDGPRPGTTMEKLATLQPAFREGGTVTAGNSCPLNDGSAAVLVMSTDRASELGLRPRARIIASSVVGLEPEYMGMGPVAAVKAVLAQAGMELGDIDVIEMNEAFAAQVLASADQLGIDMDRLNPHGGAIALGHPIGAFCYPAGFYNAAVIADVKRAKFLTATTVEAGTKQNLQSAYEMPRVRVNGPDPLSTWANKFP